MAQRVCYKERMQPGACGVCSSGLDCPRLRDETKSWPRVNRETICTACGKAYGDHEKDAAFRRDGLVNLCYGQRVVPG